MYVCDCTIWGLYPLGVPAVADCPVQNLKSYKGVARFIKVRGLRKIVS